MPQIHLRAEPGDYAPLVLLPGDPNRATRIAAMFDGGLDKARKVNDHRALYGYTGTYQGRAGERPDHRHGHAVLLHRGRGAAASGRHATHPGRHLWWHRPRHPHRGPGHRHGCRTRRRIHAAPISTETRSRRWPISV